MTASDCFQRIRLQRHLQIFLDFLTNIGNAGVCTPCTVDLNHNVENTGKKSIHFNNSFLFIKLSVADNTWFGNSHVSKLRLGLLPPHL